MIFDNDKLAMHLSGALKFKTVSNEDETKMDFSEFMRFHEYLKNTFPLLHASFKKEIIGKAALMYSLKSSDAKKPPVLLIAHQDVVPEGNAADWKYPPYSGEIAEGCVWGRGAGDCKNVLLGHMEAVEKLLSEGFTPDYDLYLAYGYNEEVSVTCENPSASLLSNEFKKRGIRIGVVFDEGGQIYPGSSMGIKDRVAQVSVGEKGFADLLVYKDGKGGHSAAPGNTSLVADVARAVIKISENPFPYRFTPEMAFQYKLLAPYVDEQKREIYEDVIKNQDKVIPMLDADPRTAARFKTTVAMTTVKGSERSNILPSRVSVNLNCRLLEGDTVESVKKYFENLMSDFEGVKIDLIEGRDPSPMSKVEGHAYKVLTDVIEQMYSDVRVLPSLCIGGTDAYYYYSVSDCVYRFTGRLPHPLNGMAHAVNEKSPVETMNSIPEFFYNYLKAY